MKNSVLYHHSISSPSRKVRMTVFEKKIANIEFKSVDIINGEQFEEWFLDLNPKGEVPVFVYYDEDDNRTVVTESTEIMKFIDSKYPTQNQLFGGRSEEEAAFQNLLDSLGTFLVTWGIFSHYKDLQQYTTLIRYPYCNLIKFHWIVKRRMFVEKPTKLIKLSEKMGPTHPSHLALRDKAETLNRIKPLFYDVSEFESEVIPKLEEILDKAEMILSKEDRIGSYMFGPVFGGVDISFTALLFRLYQLGLDEYYWKNGSRPHLSVYYNLALKRECVIKGTEEERQHENEYYVIKSDDGSYMGYVGLMGILSLSAIYVYKKLKK